MESIQKEKKKLTANRIVMDASHPEIGLFLNESGDHSPLHIFNRQYSLIYNQEEVVKDVERMLWMSYRRRFPSIPSTRISADQGWGCMLRCGQMILSESLLRLYCSTSFTLNELRKSKEYWKILEKFIDNIDHEYSIQNLTTVGEKNELVQIGEWFGPNTISQVLSIISMEILSTEKCELPILVQVAMDSTIILEKIFSSVLTMANDKKNGGKNFFERHVDCGKRIIRENDDKDDDVCRCNDETDGEIKIGEDEKIDRSTQMREWRAPLLLLIPLRLGLNELNGEYVDQLKWSMDNEYSVGFIGGRPNHALYFYGYRDDELLFLDPHTVQNYIHSNLSSSPISSCTIIPSNESTSDTDGLSKQFMSVINRFTSTIPQSLKNQFTNDTSSTHQSIDSEIQMFDDSTYHSKELNYLKFTDIDPSIALGFVFSNEKQFLHFLELYEEQLMANCHRPIFEIRDTIPTYAIPVTQQINVKIFDDNDKSRSNPSSPIRSENRRMNVTLSDDDDDFTLI
ncbi:hypothetical protein SNEBB_003884 [Seison nebaliae]|nr:hypothetical protein SNEBB_003884 [Seison nebaliae]